ncbi:MAG: TetR/AcrR family transcriptional regulator [Pseudonocardia sp.]
MTATRRPSPRDRLLDVADHLFYGRGIRAIGVDAIVAAADTAKTTLYGHFGSKDELVVAYLRRRSDLWREHLTAELASRGGPPTDRILHVFALLDRSLADPGFRGCPFINACAEFTDDHPAVTVAREHRGWLRRTFAELSGEAGAQAPDRLAGQLLMLHDGAMIAAHIDDDAEAARWARSAAATLLHTATGASATREQ